SPSFLTIKAGEKFDVIAREVAPRKAPAREPLLPKPKPVARKPAAMKKKVEKLMPPPAPPAPKAPADWLELSQKPAGATAEALKPAAAAEPEPTDDWTLVRTASGESGWILSRRVVIAIPDEVAQYAEGRRITSYFSLGEVR